MDQEHDYVDPDDHSSPLGSLAVIALAVTAVGVCLRRVARYQWGIRC
jgi:hypothetical protein